VPLRTLRLSPHFWVFDRLDQVLGSGKRLAPVSPAIAMMVYFENEALQECCGVTEYGMHVCGAHDGFHTRS
jgi:hypothetical protein